MIGSAMFAQNTEARQSAAPGKLSLRAEIVLSPEFCAARKRQSLALKDVLHTGKATCAQLYDALTPIFSDLKRVEKVSAAGTSTAQLTLIPKFADVSATQQPFLPSSQRRLVIFLEWTIQDSAGHILWLQTVQGSSEHKAGWLITAKGVSAMVDAAVSDLVKTSVTKISSAPELRPQTDSR